MKLIVVDYKRTFRLTLFIIFIIFLFSAKGYVEVSDTGYSIQTAEAILNKGWLDIPFEDVSTELSYDGRAYSQFGLGLPLFYLPFVSAGHFISSLTGIAEKEITGFLISFSNIPIAILNLILFASLLRLFSIGEKIRLLMTIALGLGTLIWRYSVYDYGEELQLLLLLTCVYYLLKPGNYHLTYSGTGFSLLILVKLVYLSFLPFLLLFIFIRTQKSLLEKIIPILRFLLPVILMISLIMLLNYLRFRNPFESGYGGEANFFYFSQLPHTIPALLFSLNKGLFIFCPVLILSILGWPQFIKQYKIESILFMSLILVNLIVNGAWWSWVGGWSWGPRLLVPLIPFWLLPLAFWLQYNATVQKYKITVIAICISVLFQIPGILVKEQQINHIKFIILTPEERKTVNPDFITGCKLFFHKLLGKDEVYSTTEFNVSNGRIISFHEYATYQGMNLWTEQISRYLNKPLLRILPLFGIVLILVLLYRIKMLNKNV